MAKHWFKFLLLFVVLTSCSPPTEEDEEVPSTILSEEQLINVLTDSYLGEGASGINVKNVNGTKFDSTYLFNPLKDNGVDKVTFDSTINYYTQHPKKLKVVYEKVLDRLSQIQAKGKLDK